jgi:hypothetical protein
MVTNFAWSVVGFIVRAGSRILRAGELKSRVGPGFSVRVGDVYPVWGLALPTSEVLEVSPDAGSSKECVEREALLGA